LKNEVHRDEEWDQMKSNGKTETSRYVKAIMNAQLHYTKGTVFNIIRRPVTS